PLLLVRRQHHDQVRFARGLGDGKDGEARRLRLLARLARLRKPDADVDPGVLEVEGVRVTLAAVADDRDLAAADEVEGCVLIRVDGGHRSLPSLCLRGTAAWGNCGTRLDLRDRAFGGRGNESDVLGEDSGGVARRW